MVTIKQYSNKYRDDLLSLNKALVNQWFKLSGNQRIKATWENLTPRERFLHGGPWNDPDLIDIHLTEHLKIGDIFVVVSEEEDVIAELEYHTFDDIFHIDWMMTHPKHRKKGIGRSLIEKCSDIARDLQLKSLDTEAEDGAKDFYTRVGFKELSPSYHRFVRSGGNADPLTVDIEWISKKPGVKIPIFGDATNTVTYIDYLIRSGIQFNQVFGYPFPSRIAYHNLGIFIQRIIPGLPNKSVLMFSPSKDANTLQWNKLEKVCSKIVDQFDDNHQSHMTFIGNKFTSWKRNKTIPRLQSQL